MRRRALFLCTGVALIALCFSLLGCGKATDPWEDEPGSPRIVVTIAPLASFVRAVAGDNAAIKCLCTTTGPHHYQPDTRDARILEKADLLLAIGLRLDDSFADYMKTVTRREDLPYTKLGVSLMSHTDLLEFKHDHSHHVGHDHHHHNHGKWDPHVWLGVAEVKLMVGVIRDELCKVDPAHADNYKKNAEAYLAKLTKLHEDGKKLLVDKKVRRLISFHEALGYLARSFDLTIAEVIETGPGDEPSAAHLAHIIKQCQNPSKPIAAITVEPQYPKSTSAAIVQRELKAKGMTVPLVEIDPLETAQVAELKSEGASWYETRMRKNLEALAKTLP